MDTSLLVAVVAGVLIPAGGGVWYLSGRLSSIEGQVANLSDKVQSQHDIVTRELTMNGGRSVKAAVIRIEEQLLHRRKLWRGDDPEGTPSGF